MSSPRSIEIRERLSCLEAEKKALEGELAALSVLKSELPPVLPQKDSSELLGVPASANIPKSSKDKVELFLKLFRCRESVYPKFWENKSKGTKGYSPACSNEWVPGVCGKPPRGKVKCSLCPNQAFPALDVVAVESHLRGNSTIGTYAIRADDTCTFLACDFDGKGWQSDVFVYQAVARELGVEVLVERSRSGDGAHAWIFFSEPVPARLARNLGTVILSKSGEVRHQFENGSYDRLFPNQDYLPKGGFGNLIALPLQLRLRDAGNTLFISLDMMPVPDQWAHLTQVHRLSLPNLRSLVSGFLPDKSLKLVPDNEFDISLTTDSKILASANTISDILLADITVIVTRGSQILVPIEGFPSKLITKLKRTASFPNPEFYKLQRMRMLTFPLPPRIIFSGELREKELILPRGVLDKVTEILRKAGAEIVVQDVRFKGKRLPVKFSGVLTPIQMEAISIMKKHDQGVLVAPPGVGKTVMGCSLIAQRKVSTLVLVHLQPLLQQWKDQISKFLDVDPKKIGVLAGAKKKRTGKIDIAMLQTITKVEDLEEIVADYGQIIIDECHHIPASSFEAVMKRFPAKFVLGLTATPYRKDGLEKILFHQCGPVRHEIKSADGGKLKKKVTIRETGFRLSEDVEPKPPYHVIAHLMTTDKGRNSLIVSDIVAALKDKRFPLVISDRKDQLETLMSLVSEVRKESGPSLDDLRCFRFEGSLSVKERRNILGQIAEALSQKVPLVIFATASLVGEGFDMPQLDALVICTPLSFKGRMVQYAGRLHRLAEGKEDVMIYDYVDSYCAVSLKMYRNRIKSYQNMGYEIIEPNRMFGCKVSRERSQQEKFIL